MSEKERIKKKVSEVDRKFDQHTCTSVYKFLYSFFLFLLVLVLLLLLHHHLTSPSNSVDRLWERLHFFFWLPGSCPLYSEILDLTETGLRSVRGREEAKCT